MDGWYFQLLMASVAAMFSLPLVFFAALMKLVVRIGPRLFAVILAAGAGLWVLAACFWFAVEPS